MKTIIVGGFWGDIPKASVVINKLAFYYDADVFNGGSFEELQTVASRITEYDVIIWFPDIDNSKEDIKIVKKLGSVMFVSKVLRENRNRIDAVTRIFKFGANAVIAIKKNDDKFNFELIDALDNTWSNSTNIKDLVSGINEITDWTKSAKREGTLKIKNPLETLIDINKKVQIESAKQNIRYFGNLSTRCTKMFPSFRTTNESCYVSARNTDKQNLTPSDMIQVTTINDKLRYFGERKPSVDTPVQMALYNILPEINFFIHGHTFIKDAKTTEHYFPCGDMREVPEIVKIISGNKGVINLKNHGFLIYADTLENLEEIVDNIIFDVKEL
jgi:hypothetical protein